MDEDTYFCIKNTNKRKYAGTAKRKGSTLRKSKASDWFLKEGGRRKQSYVTKFVTTNSEWDKKSLQRYTDDVIDDGGLAEEFLSNNSKKPINLNWKFVDSNVTYSLNKKKRWLLPEKVEKAMQHQLSVKDELEPDLTMVKRMPSATHEHCDNRSRQYRPDAIFAASSKVVKRPHGGKKARVPTRQNCREVTVKKAKKAYSWTSDLLGLTAKKPHKDTDSEQQPEILYEFGFSRRPDEFPVNHPMTTYGIEPVMMKLRGVGRQKSRRFLECDDRSIKQDIQAYNDRRNAKKKFEEKMEKSQIRKAKSESLISSVNEEAPFVGEDEQPKMEKASPKNVNAPVKGRISWSCLDGCDSSSSISDEMKDSPLKAVFKLRQSDGIDLAVSRKSLTALVDFKTGMSTYLTSSNTSPPLTSIDVSQALKDAYGKKMAPFYITIKHMKESSQFSVVPTDVDAQIMVSLKTEDDKLQSTCINFIKEKYSHGDFTAVCEIDELIKDVMSFVKQNALQMERKVDTIKSHRATSLQSLLSQFGLQNKSLTTSDISGLMTDKTIATSHEQEDFMFDEFDDDFVHIVPPPKECAGCLADISGNLETPLALNPCFHWYCETCWVDHIRNTSVPHDILCPDPNCSNKVDDITLMALLPGNEYWDLKNRQMDNYVAKNRRLSWCPNTACGKVCKLFNKNNTMMSLGQGSRASITTLMICDCNTAWCTACNKEAHWPATCVASEKYSQYLQKHALDRDQAIASGTVKPCPGCLLPVERTESGLEIQCPCGYLFCWICLKAAADCDTDHEDQESNDSVTKEINDVQKAIACRAKINSPAYRQMVENRLVFMSKRLTKKADEVAFFALNKLTDWINAAEEDGCSQQYKGFIRRFEQCTLALQEFHHVLQYLHVAMGYKRPYNRRQRVDITKKMDALEAITNNLEWAILFKECKRGDLDLLEDCEKDVTSGKQLVQSLPKLLM